MLFWYFLPPDSLIEETGAAYLPELETTCPQTSLSLRGPQETIQPHTHRAVSQDSRRTLRQGGTFLCGWRVGIYSTSVDMESLGNIEGRGTLMRVLILETIPATCRRWHGGPLGQNRGTGPIPGKWARNTEKARNIKNIFASQLGKIFHFNGSPIHVSETNIHFRRQVKSALQQEALVLPGPRCDDRSRAVLLGNRLSACIKTQRVL